jgi:hypothetical protein
MWAYPRERGGNTVAEYQRLPAIIAKPDAVYWDKEHSNLVYVANDANGGAIYIPVDAATNVKKMGRLDAIVNAYRLPATPDGVGRLETGRHIRMEENGRG